MSASRQCNDRGGSNVPLLRSRQSIEKGGVMRKSSKLLGERDRRANLAIPLVSLRDGPPLSGMASLYNSGSPSYKEAVQEKHTYASSFAIYRQRRAVAAGRRLECLGPDTA